SPSIDLSGTSSPVLNFLSAWKYTGTAMELLFSTDYVSGAPSSANWTTVPYTESPGEFEWTPSGPLSLSAYQQANFHMAFKYVGSASNGRTSEIDDIRISDQ
ncbi:MAG: choice-of-anchor J domain-containing protein, partial [Flavobacteriales bacterium]